MKRPPLLVRDNATLRARYGELAAGDVVACRLGLRQGEEHLFCDLQSRGVRLVPSALSQLCSRSKVLQARVFAPWMVPHTRAVYDLHDLMETVNAYGAAGVERVVCKLERANAGMGVLLFGDIEQVYSSAAGGALPFPCVLQPFIPDAADVRVIRLGGYTEAYRRHNPHSWRHNLHCGGRCEEHDLSPAETLLCEQIMARGGFPYAHIDLLLTDDGSCRLSEINLRGGIRGARITPARYGELLRRLDAEAITGTSPASPRAHQDSSPGP